MLNEPDSQTKTDQSLIGDLWGLVVKHAGMDESTFDGQPEDLPPKNTDRHIMLSILMAYPYLLVLLLVFSMYWDFDGIALVLFGKTIIAEGLLRILAVSGLIGFMTNWIAIEMLFRPRRKHPLLRQGLIPAQKERVARRVATAVSKDLINPAHIREKMTHGKAFNRARDRAGESVQAVVNKPEFRADLKIVISEHIHEALADVEFKAELKVAINDLIMDALKERYFERMALKIYAGIIGKETGEMVEDAIMGLARNDKVLSDLVDRVLDRVPPAIETESANLQDALIAIIYHTLEQVNLHAIVEDNLNRLDEEKLERMIKGATNAQLNYIKYLGAIIGTIGGFVIWSPIESLVVLGILATGIFVVDWLMLKANKVDENV